MQASIGTAARWIGLFLLVIAAILIPFALFGDALFVWASATLEAWTSRPWLAASLIVALLAGDAVLPVPSSLLSTAAGGLFGWRVGWLVIWSGMTLGCVAGYALGASAGRSIGFRIVGPRELERAGRLFADIGPLTLIVTRAVPVLSEAAVLAAGGARMNLGWFLLSTSAANAVVAAAYAGVGAAAQSSGSFLIVFLGLVSVPAIAWASWRLTSRKRHA